MIVITSKTTYNMMTKQKNGNNIIRLILGGIFASRNENKTFSTDAEKM